MAKDNNIIPLFRDKAKATESKVISERQKQVRNIMDRLDALYEHAEELHDEIVKTLPEGEIEGAEISKERFLGYFDSLLDSIDDTSLLLIPRADEDERDNN